MGILWPRNPLKYIIWINLLIYRCKYCKIMGDDQNFTPNHFLTNFYCTYSFHLNSLNDITVWYITWVYNLFLYEFKTFNVIIYCTHTNSQSEWSALENEKYSSLMFLIYPYVSNHFWRIKHVPDVLNF